MSLDSYEMMFYDPVILFNEQTLFFFPSGIYLNQIKCTLSMKVFLSLEILLCLLWGERYIKARQVLIFSVSHSGLNLGFFIHAFKCSLNAVCNKLNFLYRMSLLDSFLLTRTET